jgi:CheY-like chemotaxis protein
VRVEILFGDPQGVPSAEVLGGRRTSMSDDQLNSTLIVVADDNSDGAQTWAMLLSTLGYTVHTAHDGIRALEAIGELRPASVLLDLGLPGLNGFEVASAIRKHSWGRAMCLIAITGWSRQEDRDRAYAAGIDYYMIKPAGFDEVRLALETGKPRSST